MATGKLYWMIRPDDGELVPVTCTPEQLQSYWIGELGYRLHQEVEASTEADDSTPTVARKKRQSK